MKTTTVINMPFDEKLGMPRFHSIRHLVELADIALRAKLLLKDNEALVWTYQRASHEAARPAGSEMMMGTVTRLRDGENLVQADCDIIWCPSEKLVWFNQADKGDVPGAIELMRRALTV